MVINDIIEVEITDEMIESAKDIANKLKVSIGSNTRNAIEDRDIIGSIAHQAVEIHMQKMGKTFTSLRTQIKPAGSSDEGDIIYNDRIIDVKGTHGELDVKYFYNKQFLVFDSELESIKRKGITDFVFVLVDLYEKIAYIYGAIGLNEFMDNSVPVKLKWDNHGIKAYQLETFYNFVTRHQ